MEVKDKHKTNCRTCVDCGSISCEFADREFPAGCVGSDPDNKQSLKIAMGKYADEENKRIMICAAEIESEFYGRMTRVEETIEFAKRMNYSKIGIASCVGLIKESRTLARILRSHGFEVYSVACKIGAVDKRKAGIAEECMKVGPNMCNPIAQAEILNDQKTDMNIIMGLCVGHDMLFLKHAKAPNTTLIAKDRVLGHNPAAALYTAGSYYDKLFAPSRQVLETDSDNQEE